MKNKYLNYIDLYNHSVGNERRLEMLNDILENGTFLPKTVEYKDIDEAMKEWVESVKIVSTEGVEYPTMSMYSSQRFSEYSQTWKYTDTNNNLLLNFKTITRENNPKYGNIQSGLYNIPGERFYLMKRKMVQDENGSKSLLDLKMKQPVAIDLNYRVSIFTTTFQALNDFNTKMNKLFASRQEYIQPNGHFMPLILDNISDESQYNISDRQFYSQTYTIRVMAYIITEKDYRVEEKPLKLGGAFDLFKRTIKSKKAEVEITEKEWIPIVVVDDCGNEKTIEFPKYSYDEYGKIKKIKVELNEDTGCMEEEPSQYYYKPMALIVNFPEKCHTISKFTIDTDFVSESITLDNINSNNYEIEINGEKVVDKTNITFIENDEIKIKIHPIYFDKKSTIRFEGYNPSIVYDEAKDNPESELDEEQFYEEIVTS